MRPNKYTHGSGKRKIAIIPMPPLADEWLIIMENDNLGSYATAQEAVDALVGGHTTRPPSDVDPSTFVPPRLEDWKSSPA